MQVVFAVLCFTKCTCFIVYFLLGISPASMYNMPTFRNHVSVPVCVSLLPDPRLYTSPTTPSRPSWTAPYLCITFQLAWLAPVPFPTTVYMASPFLTPHSLLPAFEDGTDTWFRNVGILYIDAGEIPKRKYTIFKSRRKLEIYSTCFTLTFMYFNNCRLTFNV